MKACKSCLRCCINRIKRASYQWGQFWGTERSKQWFK